MKNRISLILLFFLACLTFDSCKKDKNTDKEDQQFCAWVEAENYIATGPAIDDFLSSLENNSSDTNLEKLRVWLESKSCIDSVKILCNSCIETLPPQSELSVTFSVNGKPVTLILDILMDTPLHFRTFHE